jgi:hypothetical protein
VGSPFHVRPGQHEARVKVHLGEGSSGQYWTLVPDIHRTISFSTEASRKYQIRARRINDISCCPLSVKPLAVWNWAEEYVTGNLVSGEMPPDD